jgi:hypothetical protein
LDNRFPSFLFHFPIVLMLFFEYIRHRSRDTYPGGVVAEVSPPGNMYNMNCCVCLLHILGMDMHSMADFLLL